MPGIEPGTLRIRLQPLSASQPIGLIPSQDKGSPELSYVSELDKNTHRNNLVAEKVTWAFSKLKKTLFWKTSIVLMWYMPAGAFFLLKKQLFNYLWCFSIFDDLEEGDNDDNNNDDDNNDDDMETPDPVQAQIPSHPGIKYLVRGIPPSDYDHRIKNTAGDVFWAAVELINIPIWEFVWYPGRIFNIKQITY